MSEGSTTVKMFCPACGQKLAIPTADLRRSFRCPRCRAVRVASELVPTRKTLPAVPISELDGYELALHPEQAAAGVSEDAGEEAAPPTEPVRTDPMPGAPGRVLAPAARAGLDAPVVATALHTGGPRAATSDVVAVPDVSGGPTPGLKTRAVEGAVAGAKAAGRVASFVLSCAGAVDRFLDGKRAGALFTVSLVVLIAPVIDRASDTEVASVLSVVAFVAMVSVMSLARIDAFRDDSGFHLKLVWRTVVEAGQSIAGWGTRVRQATLGQKAIDLAAPVLFACLVTAASASVAAACGVENDVVSTMQWCGLAALSVGGVVYGGGWWTLRKKAKDTGLTVDAADAAVASQALHALPFVVDCRDANAVDAVAKRSGHPLVRALLLELVKPWPRPRYDDERECQDRLLKRLRLSMPEANPRAERWIGERQRADLLLGDDEAGLLIELKVHANTAAIDRLIGQAWKYLDVWKGRGPMLLVLCNTDPEDAAVRLQREVDRMRREGHAVLAVFAMP